MSEKKYAYSGRKFNAPANVVGAELEKLRKRGKLTASAVVEAAKPKASPLHKVVFDKGTQAAAREYYLIRARTLIRSVTVIREDGDREPAFIHVPKIRNEGHYETKEVIVQHPDMFASALREAQIRMNSAERAVRSLQEAAKGLDDEGRMARVALAVRAVETASEAVRALQ